MSYFYRVYGLNVKSEILVPELTILKDDRRNNIDVNICYKSMDADIKMMMFQGEKSNYEKQKMWFHIPNLATYCISNGNEVNIELCENADMQLVKVYILGSVMGLVLLQRNMVAIHGGSIVINNKGYIFTGDKGAGKSTITTALRQKGYKFVSDDVASIKDSKISEIYPGFGYQKLCHDTMLKLGYNPDEFKPFRSDMSIKYIVPALDSFVDENVECSAIFELIESDVDKVEIKEVFGKEKLDRVIKNIFRIEMLMYAGGMPPEYFAKCLSFVKNIKYYKMLRPKGKFTVNEQINIIEDIIFDKVEDKLETAYE